MGVTLLALCLHPKGFQTQRHVRTVCLQGKIRTARRGPLNWGFLRGGPGLCILRDTVCGIRFGSDRVLNMSSVTRLVFHRQLWVLLTRAPSVCQGKRGRRQTSRMPRHSTRTPSTRAPQGPGHAWRRVRGLARPADSRGRGRSARTSMEATTTPSVLSPRRGTGGCPRPAGSGAFSPPPLPQRC